MKTFNKEIVNHAIDRINDMIGYGETEASELHFHLFNEDYFIIGYGPAEEFLNNGPGIFNAIEEIKEYEQFNFGQVSTDLSSSENVANMYAYIHGEELLYEIDTLQNKHDRFLDDDDLKAIIEELEEYA